MENELYRKLIGVRNYLDEMKTVDFYSRSCIVAIDSYKNFIQFFVEHFSEIEKSAMQDLLVFISTEFVPSVRYIERASTANIPWSIIPYLEKMLKEKFGSDYMLLFRPQWHFNYTVITDDLIDPLRKILQPVFPTRAAEIADLFPKQKIHVFSFPYLEKTNALLYAVIGHEIGHFYHNRWRQSPAATTLMAGHQTDLLTFYRTAFPTDLFRPMEKTGEGMNILEGMYRETLADICGYMLFGPSMLFALDSISVFETTLALPTKSNSYYPMTKYRIRLLYERIVTLDKRIAPLSEGGSDCSKYFRAFLKSVQDKLAPRDDVALLQQIGREMMLFEASVESLIDFARAQIPENELHPEITSELFRKLDETLPINELDGRPTSMADILLAGWIYSLKVNEISTKPEYVTEYQILMRLLLKSLFSSYVHAEYSGLRGRQ